MLVEKCTYVKMIEKIIVKKHQVPSISAFTAVCRCLSRSCNERNMSFAFAIDRARSR